MSLAFRLYGAEGCVHCERAAQFLMQAQVPTQLVLVANDPVVSEGLKKIQGKDAFAVPTLVSFTPDANGQGEVVVGFKEEDYKRVVENYRARSSARAFTVSAAGGDNPGATPAVAEEPQPVSEGAA